MIIEWDFTRELDAAATPGNTTSYQDETCQSFYIDGVYIKTQTAPLEDGDWENIVRSAEIPITDDMAEYSHLDIEHHYNDFVYGSAKKDSDVVFLVYNDMKDISDMAKDGSWQMQPDNPIKAGSVTVKNFDDKVFEDSVNSIFLPGNRIRFRFRAGDSVYYDVGTIYIESSPYTEGGAEFKYTGRNKIGFYLSSQMFDENTEYSGTLTGIFEEILNNAGMFNDDILIEDTLTEGVFSFSPTDNIMSGLLSALEISDWYMDDQPSGRIVIGSAEFIRLNAATTAIYSFDRGSEVFSRSVDRNINGVFSRVCVVRNGPEPLRIYSDVGYYEGWHLTGHRTFYQTVPDTTTQEQMEAVGLQLVSGMQYSGITEKFDSPFRPWLQVGDVAYITGGVLPRLAGIISSVQHDWGEDGFFTSFTVISGGEISNPGNPETIASKYVGRMGGANRQRRLLDFITGATSSSMAGASTVGAVAYQAAVAGGYMGDEQAFNANLSLVADGAVVPDGGIAGQILEKDSNTDYDVVWGDKPQGIPDSGDEGQVLKKVSGADYDVAWQDEAGGVTNIDGGSASSVYGGALVIDGGYS